VKFLLDQFPIIVFFVAYFVPHDRSQALFVATAAAIPASLIQVAIHRLLYRRFDRGQLITLALLAILGGATLLLQDKRYIMWKPTAVYWLFAAVFLGSQFVGGKTVTQRIMGHALAVPAAIWRRANLSWVVFFILMGIANLFVAFNFSEATWVKYKLFGTMALFFVFTLAQFAYLSHYAETQQEKG